MTNKEEYDFVEMGIRCAKERMENLIAMADKVETEYGIDARLEFESGIALVVPVYPQNIFTNFEIEKRELERGGTKDYGVSYLLNESYLSENRSGSKRRQRFSVEDEQSKSK